MKRLLMMSALMLSVGCYTTVIRNGKPASLPTTQYDEKWHSGVVYGIAELSGPYDLSKACPSGWAEVETETSFLNGFVQALTFSLYNPQSVTIRCVATSASAPSNNEPAPSDANPTPAAP